jgi:CO/xanthine dehydrogenase FAD-binding subunit
MAAMYLAHLQVLLLHRGQLIAQLPIQWAASSGSSPQGISCAMGWERAQLPQEGSREEAREVVAVDGRRGPAPALASISVRRWTPVDQRGRSRAEQLEVLRVGIEIAIAENLEDALDRLAREGSDLRPVAGATDLMLRLKAGRLRAARLLSIADLSALAYVRQRPDAVDIGALTLVADLIGHPIVRSELPAVERAARDFASPQIRNRATVGGNIGNASPAADLVCAFIALGARVALRSLRGDRSMPLEELFTGPGTTLVAPVAVELPRRAAFHQSFAKFGNRSANVIAAVNMAIALELDAGLIRSARVAYGCCAPVPLRARGVEGYLAGKVLDEPLISGVRDAVLAEIRPIGDVRGSRRYKELLAVHATEDALAQALELERARSGLIG